MLICSDLQSVPVAKKKRALEDVASEGKRIEGPLTAEYIEAMEEELKKQKEEHAAEKNKKNVLLQKKNRRKGTLLPPQRNWRSKLSSKKNLKL